jgi:phosphoribosyl-ATP pyrophosphohydrolase/phosphoribosyl-AMP cyclohydrolase
MPRLPLKFDAQGLVPTIVQDRITGEIRMFAFATDAAVWKTLETGNATFWSRSRSELWQKGRAGGQETPVVGVLADCDGDCVIYSSDPHGPSCHSGAPSCFFQALDGERLVQASEQPQTLLASLEASVEGSRNSAVDTSVTRRLLETGSSGVAARFREQAGEFAQALEKQSDERVVSEAADTLYHLIVGLCCRSIPLRRVLVELARRFEHSKRPR